MIHEEICTYEVCKLAKEKGFDVPTAEFYNEDGNVGCYPRAFPHNEFPDGDYAAPTQTLLQRWLREERGIHITLDCELNYEYDIFIYVWRIDYRDSDNRHKVHSKYSENAHDTYERALKEALKYALENLV